MDVIRVKVCVFVWVIKNWTCGTSWFTLVSFPFETSQEKGCRWNRSWMTCLLCICMMFNLLTQCCARSKSWSLLSKGTKGSIPFSLWPTCVNHGRSCSTFFFFCTLILLKNSNVLLTHHVLKCFSMTELNRCTLSNYILTFLISLWSALGIVKLYR